MKDKLNLNSTVIETEHHDHASVSSPSKLKKKLPFTMHASQASIYIVHFTDFHVPSSMAKSLSEKQHWYELWTVCNKKYFS